MEMDNILKQYAQLLKRFFSTRVRNHSDAEDLVQEVLQKTLLHSENIKHPENFRAWLFTVARNALVDYYRQSARYVNKELDIAMEWDKTSDAENELSKCIRPFINQLPAEYRHVLKEVELNGRRQKQMAVDMGMTYSTLKSRVQRGRTLLKNLLQQCCSYEFDKKGGIIDFKLKGANCRKSRDRPHFSCAMNAE